MRPTRSVLPSQLAFFSLEEEAKNIFSRWPPRQPSWISDRDDFSYFWSTNHHNASYQVSSQLAFQFSRRKPWRPPWTSDRDILAIFDLYVTPMLPTKFGVNWLLGLGEEAKNRFSRWPPWWPSWISDRHNFSYFWSTSHPDASYLV